MVISQAGESDHLQNVYTNYWAHPDPYSMTVSILFPVTESQEKLMTPLHLVAMFTMNGAILHSPYMPSFHRQGQDIFLYMKFTSL
jgi:hypothetical protein